MVIEDETDLRDALVSALGAAGYLVVPMVDAETALASVTLVKPDLILLDLFTGSIHGTHFLERLHLDPTVADTKVIVITNNENDQQRHRTEELGVAEYVIKSDSSIEEIVSLIKKYC